MRPHAPRAIATGKRDAGSDAPAKDNFKQQTALRNQGGFLLTFLTRFAEAKNSYVSKNLNFKIYIVILGAL